MKILKLTRPLAPPACVIGASSCVSRVCCVFLKGESAVSDQAVWRFIGSEHQLDAAL